MSGRPFAFVTDNNRTRIHKIDGSRIRDVSPTSSPAAVTALVQSPVMDIVGIGYSSGEIVLYDIREDEQFMRMFMEGGLVRGLSFRDG